MRPTSDESDAKLFIFFVQSRSLTSFKNKENYFAYVIISMFSIIFSTFLGFKCSKSSRQKYRLPHPRHFLAALTNQMQAIQIALIWLVRKLDTWLWRSPPFSITISLILASWRHCGNFHMLWQFCKICSTYLPTVPTNSVSKICT